MFATKLRQYWIPVARVFQRPSVIWAVGIFTGLVAYNSLPTLVLSLKSPEQHPRSIRTLELEHLQTYPWGKQNYIVVMGPKGVGKSCLIDTFTSNKRGVIKCRIAAGTDQQTIVNKVLQEITFPMPLDVFLEYRALWAIYLYKYVFQKSPILVFCASERSPTRPPAELTGAVRHLTENYGFHVIVDCCPNDVDTGLLETKRQTVVNIEPYDQDSLWKLPEFQVLFEDLETIGLKTTVWSVLGGFPVLYEEIDGQSSAFAERDANGKLTEAGKKTLQDIVWKTLEGEIDRAIGTLGSERVKHHQMETILELLDEKTLSVPSAVLASKKIKCLDTDKALREVFQNGKRFFVPATPAIGLVIRHNLTGVPPPEKLIELLK